MFGTVMGVVTPLLDEQLQEDPMEVDNDASKSSTAADL